MTQIASGFVKEYSSALVTRSAALPTLEPAVGFSGTSARPSSLQKIGRTESHVRQLQGSRRSKGELTYADCADRSVDGSHSAAALRRHRARRSLAGGGTGRPRSRRHAVRQRRFAHVGTARGDVATGAAPRRRRSRSQRLAYEHAGTCAAVRRRFRLPALPSRLLSVLAVLAPIDAFHHDVARTSRSVGTSDRVRDLFRRAGGVDLGRAETTGAACQMGANDPSRNAGAAAHATTGEAGVPRLPRPHLA